MSPSDQQNPIANGSNSPSQPRVKNSRPHSPVRSTSDLAQHPDAKPSAPKRARKAINCEPCRSSKLKCDRYARVDPAAEIARIRQSISLLESHIVQIGARSTTTNQSTSSTSVPAHKPIAHTQTSSVQSNGTRKRRSLSPVASDMKVDSVPGLVGQSDTSGFYTGPTSALSHLLSVREDDNVWSALDNLGSSLRSTNAVTESPVHYQSYDEDLISLLPPIHTVDGLIDYYFEYCNWIYRHVNQSAFMNNWTRYKTGYGGDRIVLSTVCVLILLAVRYLPINHPLMATLPGSIDELSTRYYGVMREALDRHQRDLRRDGMSKGYSLELVELLLVRSHYLTFSKEDPEETWAVKGELVNIGTAMGLHKDPGDTRFSYGEAERRRWAWWHIILFERWQAFMFGRPLAIASHHYNTRLPSDCDRTIDKSGRLYLPNIALFKLAACLGHIMNDAVSFQPVSYSSIEAHDRRLTDWFDELPEELDLDEFRVMRSLASPITSVRRLGVQSVIIRTAYYHIRFTLHRPYANVPSSLSVAVGAAGKLITLVGQTRPEFLNNTALAVPGHMNWGPFHIFSAAMFFSFQLIMHPDQPAASFFREHIRKSINCLEQSRWMPVADKALTILQALAPLYSDDFANEPPQERRRKKAQVLKLVKTLAFPYQDAGSFKSESSSSSSPAIGGSQGPQGSSFSEDLSSPTYGSMQKRPQIPLSSLRWTPSDTPGSSQFRSPAELTPSMHIFSPSATSPVQQGPHGMLPHHQHNSPQALTFGTAFDQNLGMHQAQTNNSQQLAEISPKPSSDEGYMWGASVGFGLGEWAQFLDVVQRPDDWMRGLSGVAK
ncbi:hypothetical protein BC835DRAFT_1523216 [Cytidiella melzeri]|nr:hypothetical protein BC835DRAFT_1523216 [Cytidiella melzeri]